MRIVLYQETMIVPCLYLNIGRLVQITVLFCHDHLSHLIIDASSYMKLMHTRRSGSSTSTLFRHISPVSQDRFWFSFLLIGVFSCRQFGNLCLPLFGVKYVTVNSMCRSITIF